MELLYNVGENAKWYSSYGNVYDSSKKIELLYDPIMLFVGICPKEMKLVSQKDISSLMFIVALFTIAKMWKQPKCPTDE